MTHYIALTCSAVARSIYAVAATAPAAISTRLLDQGLHRDADGLRRRLQTEIDAIGPEECDAILLVFGVCGTSTIGLAARHTPLVVARVHDCISLYLGSHDRYQQEFDAHPGTYWYSVDYMERSESGGGLGASSIEFEDAYEEYVEKFGRDNADYLMETMGEWAKHYTRAAFIETGMIDGKQYEQEARERAERRGWVFERKVGDPRLLEMLLAGRWPEDEFLVVPPGHVIRQPHDERLVHAVPTEDS